MNDLIAQLTDSSDTARACRAYNLGAIGEREAAPALLVLLEKAIDRRAAALALGKIGSAEAIPALRVAPKDKDAVVQRLAFEALEGGVRRAA